ncbi:hypothetical protein Q7P37_010678 [Cladosporium fusiforme]
MRELFTRLRPQLDPVALQPEGPIRSNTNDVDPEKTDVSDTPKEATVVAQPRSIASNDNDSDDEIVHKDAQYGVQKIEATTQAWSKKHLIAAYIMIWIIAFINALEQGMGFGLTSYVTSEFSLHSLTSATGVMSSLIGGLTKLPLAKLIDIWGRPQGYMVMVGCLTLGLIMMAACNGVELYAAAQVFYWIGLNGTDYVVSVFVADTSSLKNRGLMFAFLASPYIITSWVAGPLAQAFLGIEMVDGVPVIAGIGWRWAYGTFAIVTPIISFPLFALFQYNYRKAVKAGLMPVHESSRTLTQSIKYYLIQFDALGLLLIVAGLALFLLPFNIYSYQAKGFASPMIICMIVFGVAFMVAFACWERFGAPVTFIPYHLLKDRTVLGANLLAAVIFFGFYMWNGMFFSFLQVVPGLNYTHATYMGNIYSIGSCLWSFAAGILISKTGRFKAQALYFGVPITILGAGLMIHFRQPDVNVGFIVLCQVLIAFAGGTLVITEQIAVMAATTHQFVAVVLAVQYMFSSVGGAIGQTVSTAIWTGTFRDNLIRFLPESELANVDSIYSNLVAQLAFPEGTPERAAIQAAYGESQKWQLTAAVVSLSLMFPCVIAWRNYNLKEHKQVKGTVI